jgi:hypothetical protein
MMSQQRAAERQAAQASQAMEFARAEEARKAELHGPGMANAGFEAMSQQAKLVDQFLDLSIAGMQRARNPEDALKIGQYLKQTFNTPELQGIVDQTLSSLPSDPAQFENWRQETLFQSMDAKDQLAQQFQRQTTGREERIIATPTFAGAPGGGAAVEVPGSRIQAAEDITYVRGPNGEIIPMPKTVPGTGGPVGGAQPAPMGAGSADVVYGFGKFAQPSKPISSMTIGEVQNFQKNELIPATRGKIGAGPDKGTGAVGTYQIVYGTLKDYAPKVLGPNWRNTPFTADVQDRIAKAIYEDVKNGNLKDTWAGLPNNRPGAYSNVPWEQVRGQIAAVESAGGAGGKPAAAGGVNIQMGQPLPGTGKGPKIAAEALTAMEGVTAKYDKTIELAERLLKNPALDSIIGNVQGNVPETVLSVLSQDAANALSDYNALLAVAGFQELQAMRDASPTGGALGQVSDSENRLLQQSAFASSRTQSEAKFRESVKTYLKLLRESKGRVENAYERTYGGRFAPQRAPAAAAAPAGGKPKTPTRTSGGATVTDW